MCVENEETNTVEEMQRRLRDELDIIKQSWGSRLGTGSSAPKYNFTRLAPFKRIASGAGTGRNASRVETLYEHVQEEIGAWQAQVGEGEYLAVLFITARGDMVQVGNISYRNPDLLIIEGVDDADQRSRILAPAGSVQLIMKIMKAGPDAASPSTDFQFGGQQGSN